MEKNRIGNDMNILWEIFTGSKSSSIPYDLTGRNLTLYLTSIYGREKVEGFTTDGNVIHWTFLGREQKHTGIYMLTLVENEGMDGMHTVDECDAFELVRCSCNEGGEAESSVTIHTVRLRSGISINSLIPDTELDEESHNVVENMAVAKAMKNKANVSDLESLSVEMQNKADISDLDTLSEVVDTKANQLAFEILSDEVSSQASMLAGKADKSGDYPNMSVGLAEDLGGRPFFEDAEFSFRATAGSDVSIKDGLAIAKELRGNAVVWNNMVDTRGYEGQLFITTGIRIVKGHKYLLYRTEANRGLYLIPIVNGIENYDMVIREDQHSGIFQAQYSDDNGKGTVYSEGYCGACIVSDLTLMFGAGNEPSTIEEYYARKPIVEDEYAYNEGEMIADNSTAIKSIGDNAWDEQWELGSINPITGACVDSTTQIRSKNFYPMIGGVQYVLYCPSVIDANSRIILYDADYNIVDFWGFAISSYRVLDIPINVRFFKVSMAASYGTVYKSDVTISLYHSGWKAEVDNVYKPYVEFTREIDQRILDAFPNGRKPWDKVYNKNGKGYIVKGTGEVDLGSLNWINDSWNGVVAFSTLDVGNSTPHVYDLLGNSLTAIYSQKSNFAFLSEGDNKVYVLNSEAHIPNTLAIRDSAYTDASTFKTAMNGVMLWYELAEPTIIEYDEPFALDYEVWDFGTEQIISDTPSAPMRASIQYDFNANDTIRTNRLAIGTLRMEVLELRRQIESIMASITNTTEE